MAVADFALGNALAGRAALEEPLGALPIQAELGVLVKALLVAAVARAVAEPEPLEALVRAAPRPRFGRVAQPKLFLDAQACRTSMRKRGL